VFFFFFFSFLLNSNIDTLMENIKAVINFNSKESYYTK